MLPLVFGVMTNVLFGDCISTNGGGQHPITLSVGRFRPEAKQVVVRSDRAATRDAEIALLADVRIIAVRGIPLAGRQRTENLFVGRPGLGDALLTGVAAAAEGNYCLIGVSVSVVAGQTIIVGRVVLMRKSIAEECGRTKNSHVVRKTNLA